MKKSTETSVAIGVAVCVVIGLVVWLVIHSVKGSKPAKPGAAGAAGGPSGRYVGDLTLFGKVEASLDFRLTPTSSAGAGVVSFTVTAGSIIVSSSPGDSYQTIGGVISLTESAATLASLQSYGLKIESVVYTPASNTIDVKVGKSFLAMTVTLYSELDAGSTH